MKTALLIQCLILGMAIGASAARLEPNPVLPVQKDGIEYRVDHSRMGVVEARDLTTQKKLWELMVYMTMGNSQCRHSLIVFQPRNP